MKHELAVLLALGACGSDAKPASPDAADVADATNPDAQTTGVATFTIRNVGNTVTSNLPVSFTDKTGTPTQVVMTDANGTATATVTTGDTATLIVGTAASATVLAVYDVHPGDAIVVEGAAAPGAAKGAAKVSVPTFAGAASYDVSAGCTASDVTAGTATLTLGAACVGAANTYDLNAYAYDGTGKAIAYQSQFDLVPPGLNNTANIALGSWRTDFVNLSMALTNAPASTMEVTANIAAQREARTFQTADIQKAVAAGGTAAFDLPTPKGTWSGFRYQINTSDGDSARSGLLRTVPTLPTGLVTVDLTADMLPFIHGVTFDLPTGDTMPRFQYAPDASLASVAGVLAAYQYTTTAGTVSGYVALPPGTLSASLPKLPDSLSAYRPATPFVGAPAFVYALDGGIWTDAKSFRQTWAKLLVDPASIFASSMLRVSTSN